MRILTRYSLILKAALSLAIVFASSGLVVSQQPTIQYETIRYEGMPGGRCDGEPTGPLFGGAWEGLHMIFGSFSPDPTDSIFNVDIYSMPRVRIFCNFINNEPSESMMLRHVGFYYSADNAQPGWLTARLCQKRIALAGISCGRAANLPTWTTLGSTQTIFIAVEVPPIKRDSMAFLQVQLLGPGWIELDYVEAIWSMPRLSIPDYLRLEPEVAMSMYVSRAEAASGEMLEQYQAFLRRVDAEAVDEPWAAGKSLSIRESFSARESAELMLRKVDCRSAVCGLTIDLKTAPGDLAGAGGDHNIALYDWLSADEPCAFDTFNVSDGSYWVFLNCKTEAALSQTAE